MIQLGYTENRKNLKKRFLFEVDSVNMGLLKMPRLGEEGESGTHLNLQNFPPRLKIYLQHRPNPHWTVPKARSTPPGRFFVNSTSG